MNKLALLAGVFGVAAFALASGAGAGPLGNKDLNATELNMVDTVHGCHRDVRRDALGWHFHGRRCHRVDVAGPGPRPKCYFIGPLRICD